MSTIPRALPFADRLRDRRDSLLERWEAWRAPEWVKPAGVYSALALFGIFWGVFVGYVGTPALLVAVSLFACLLCLRDFRNGAVLLCLIMPIANSYVFPHAMFGITGMNPLNMLLGMTLVMYLMNSLGQKGPSLLPRFIVWPYLVPLFLGAMLGMRHIDEIPYTFRMASGLPFDSPVGYVRDYFLKPFQFVLYAMLVAAAVYRSEKPEKFITPLLISVWVIALTIVGFVVASGVELSSLSGEYSRHFLSPLGMHANDLGRLYAVAYALLLFVWDRSDHMLHKTFLFLSMGVVVMALLLTFSRGAFFGFIIVNLIYLFSRRHAKTLLLAALAVPVALVAMPGAIWYRLQMGFGNGANAISAGRLDDIWIPLMPEFLASPVWGQGLGSIMWSRHGFGAHPLRGASPQRLPPGDDGPGAGGAGAAARFLDLLLARLPPPLTRRARAAGAARILRGRRRGASRVPHRRDGRLEPHAGACPGLPLARGGNDVRHAGEAGMGCEEEEGEPGDGTDPPHGR